MARDITATKLPLWIMMLLVSAASFSTMIFVPALPAISEDFNLTNRGAQQLLVFILLGYGGSSLFYGPCANYIRHKPTVYLGLSIALFAGVLAIIAMATHTYWLLVLYGFVVGFGTGVGLTVGVAIVSVCSTPKVLRQRMSILLLSFCVSPFVGNVIGGFLVAYIGWMACVFVLMAYHVYLLYLVKQLPDTSPEIVPGAPPPSVAKELRRYRLSLRHRRLWMGGILAGGCTSAVYVFWAKAPFISMNVIGLTPDIYGLLGFLPQVGMTIGLLSAAWIANRLSLRGVLRLGIGFAWIMLVIMLILFGLGKVSAWTLFVPIMLAFIGFSMVYSNAFALAMAKMRNKPTASAVLSFMNIGMGALATLLASSMNWTAPISLPVMISVLLGVMTLLIIIMNRWLR